MKIWFIFYILSYCLILVSKIHFLNMQEMSLEMKIILRLGMGWDHGNKADIGSTLGGLWSM